MSQITITPALVEAFMVASHDRNPLHIDAGYARTTPFGQPVVYGVLGILAALGKWANGNPLVIGQVKAVFKKPLFIGQAYGFRSEDRNGRIQLVLFRGPVDYLQLSFQPAELPALENEAIAFDPANLPADIGQKTDFNYAIDATGAATLQKLTGLEGVLTDGQLAAFLWSSFWIGMVNPGPRALFAEIEFNFAHQASQCSLQMHLDPPSFDARFNRMVQTGSGTGISALKLAAFVRPEPVELDWALLRQHEHGPWEGKRVCVSGAGRGFGAALAAVAGFEGAQLALLARSQPEKVLGMFEGEGLHAQVFQADLSQEAQVEEMAKAVALGAKIDLLVLNATPPIRHAWLLEQSAGEFMEFVQTSMAMTVLVTRALLPHLAENATVVLVSTEYLGDPQRGFSHYLAAKAGQEAFLEAMATETQGVRWMAARLPRMLTDQTNLPFDHRLPPRAETVAAALLSRLAEQPHSGGFHRIELQLDEED